MRTRDAFAGIVRSRSSGRANSSLPQVLVIFSAVALALLAVPAASRGDGRPEPDAVVSDGGPVVDDYCPPSGLRQPLGYPCPEDDRGSSPSTTPSQQGDRGSTTPEGSQSPSSSNLPSPPASQSSPFQTGGTTSGLGAAGAPQSAAPAMMGDLFNVGQSSIVIPVITGPGTTFMQTISPTQLASTPVPAIVQGGSPSSAPVLFTSPNNPPFFPPRTFSTLASSTVVDNAFVNQHQGTFAIVVPNLYNHDAQAYLISQHPAGSTLPTGQVASGGGTATLIGNGANGPVAVSAVPPTGQPLDSAPFDLFTSYNYTPNVFQGPQQPVVILIPSPASSGAALVGINKIAENTSPMPRDRVFFNYSLFAGTQLGPGGLTVNRFVPGFEKTFFNGRASIETRFPFAASISPDFALNSTGITNNNAVVFGNMSVVLKEYITRSDTFLSSWGLQTALPTAPSLSVFSEDGQKVLAINNRSVHLMPFLGALYTPNERFFAQGFFQLDVDTNGNPVAVDSTSSGLTQVGRLHDATLMYLDVNSGYWLYRGSSSSRLTGFAPTVEFHYNSSLAASQTIVSNGFMIGSNMSQVSNQSMTVGCYFEFDQNSTLALGYTVPFGNVVDQSFHGELRAFLTHRFGTSSRAARVGF